MTRTFEIVESCHSTQHTKQWCIQAHDLTKDECTLLRGIVMNNWIDSADYQVCNPVGAFLQGFEPPYAGADGWVMIEFWSQDMAAIKRCVDHINTRFSQKHEDPNR